MRRCVSSGPASVRAAGAAEVAQKPVPDAMAAAAATTECEWSQRRRFARVQAERPILRRLWHREAVGRSVERACWYVCMYVCMYLRVPRVSGNVCVRGDDDDARINSDGPVV